MNHLKKISISHVIKGVFKVEPQYKFDASLFILKILSITLHTWKAFFSHIYINIPYDYLFEKIPGEDHLNIKFIVMGFIKMFEQSEVSEQQQYITKNKWLVHFQNRRFTCSSSWTSVCVRWIQSFHFSSKCLTMGVWTDKSLTAGSTVTVCWCFFSHHHIQNVCILLSGYLSS